MHELVFDVGINPEEDHRYLYIAENALLAPLPEYAALCVYH